MTAREDPKRPFRFVVTETLKDDPRVESIDAFLNSQARRLLALYPDRHMLLVRNPSNGAWRTLGAMNGEVASVVRRILRFSETWRPMETNNAERLAEFSKLLGHTHL